VWKVTLQLDDQNRGASLSATRLSSFPREDCGLVDAISLLGKYIAFGVITTTDAFHYMAIVDWEKANSQSQSHRRTALKLSYPRKIIPIDSSHLVGVS